MNRLSFACILVQIRCVARTDYRPSQKLIRRAVYAAQRKTLLRAVNLRMRGGRPLEPNPDMEA
jgi:hypothetical protein